MSIKVFLADDHRIVREGIKALIEDEEDMEVVGEARDGREVVQKVAELKPDVVVMDVGMPNLNGMEATRHIKSANPELRVIALSMYADKRYVLGMLEAGASGYVLKFSSGEDLVRAIRAVHRGQKYLSAEIAGLVVDSYINKQTGWTSTASSILGSREREVLQLLAEGKTSGEIASDLHIAISTVETHRRNIMRKLDLHNIAGLTKYAVREGMTTLDF